MTLPIAQVIDEILEQFPAARVVIQAPPGAGKSTWLPLQLLHSEHTGTMVMLQPRRLAAVNVANYLAEQLGESVGDTVGYSIRGEQKRSASTRLMVITEGVLVRWLQNDPELNGIDTVLFDEFHERNLASDLSLALLLDSLTLRPELSLMIMSATLPAEPIQAWLQQALAEPVKVVKSEGRQYPLTIHYRPPGRDDWLERLVAVTLEALAHAEKGVLVFVPGVREIQRIIQELSARTQVPCLPLHGQLSLAEQRRALCADPVQRIIVATNVAETSLTIDGIDTVIDSGRERVSRYRPHYATAQLLTRYLSKASATQRAGRAGRQNPGSVYRLWSQSDEHGFSDYAEPDVATQDLTPLVAEVSLWGSSVDELCWLSEPSQAHAGHAIEVLEQLGLCTQQGGLTEVGRQAVTMGADIRLARVALAAVAAPSATRFALACTLATLEEPAKPYLAEALIETVERHLAQAKQLKRWRQRQQFWCKQLAVEVTSMADWGAITEYLLYGFPERVAKRVTPDSVQLVSGVRLQVVDEKPVSEWSLVLTIRLAEDVRFHKAALLAPLQKAELIQHPAVAITEHAFVDVAAGRHAALIQEQRLGQLLLERQRLDRAPAQQDIHMGLIQWLRREGIEALNWTDAATRLWHRSFYLYQHVEEARSAFQVTLPTPESLLDNLEDWALPFWSALRSLNDLQRWDPHDAVRHWLDYSQQQLLERLCPSTWRAPSGRQVLIQYPNLTEARQGIKPRAEVKLQEAFGEPVSPTLLDGRQPLTLDLLSPAGRLLQRTENLASFWQNGYPEVKKEMRGRYPKHPWPDDPLSAEATLKTKRQLR